jgi:uncharacterized protein (TIGR02996 family)
MLTPRLLPDRLPSEVALDPEEEGLLRGCLACPWDDASFLVYADWLDDNRQTERADFVRLQVAQVGLWRTWEEAPDSVRAWTGRVFPGFLHQRLGFARGLPGILRVGHSQAVGLASRYLAGWIWGIQSEGNNPVPARELTSSPHLAWLTSLYLEHNWIRVRTPEALAPGYHLPRVTPGWRRNYESPDAGLQVLADCLPRAPLTALGLWDNEIGDLGVEVWAASPHLARLTYLDLRNNRVGVRGAQALAGNPHLTQLTSLDLGYNRVGDAGVEVLAGSPHLTRLTSLALPNNSICTKGAQAIATSPHLGRLATLHLGYNQIGDEGAEALAASPYLAQLTSLNLVDNQIGVRGARALAASPHLTRLTSLWLWDNQIGAEGARALRQSASFRGCKISGID